MNEKKQIRLTKRRSDRVYIKDDVIPFQCDKLSFCHKYSCVLAGEKDGCPYLKLLYRLAELEDEIENGKLVENEGYRKQRENTVELPCKIGDTVYYIEGAYYKSKRQTVTPIKVTEISWKCDRSGRDLGFALIANGTRYKFSSIGKTVFLTKEEAEQALEKMKGE
jgi:hypothetical protein